jgi:hypothetical protein
MADYDKAAVKDGKEWMKMLLHEMQWAMETFETCLASVGQDSSFADQFYKITFQMEDLWVDLKNPTSSEVFSKSG